jgi:hypothetical protein
MSLLTQASLILTPTAYKATDLYSIVPSNGNGDMTVVRNTTATRVNSSQLIESVAINVPRLNYDANGSASILLEPQRTNSTANSTMVGASASSGAFPTLWTVNSGGLTQSVVGVGTENGLSYIDVRFFGTAPTTSSGIRTSGTTVVAASASQVWSSSAYLKIVAEPLPATNYRLNNIERNSAGGFLTSYSTMFTNTTLQRIVRTFTVLDALTAFMQVEILATLVAGQSYDFTIRIAAPQLELGAYPTSFIPTTTTALSRNADVLSRDNVFTNGLITSAGGTWFVEIDNNFSLIRDGASSNFGLQTSSVSNANGLVFKNGGVGGGALRLQISKRLASIESALYTTLTDKIKAAIKWNGATADVFVNGIKVVSANAFTETIMEFLNLQAQDVPKYIKSTMLFPTPLTDAEMTALTTL